LQLVPQKIGPPKCPDLLHVLFAEDAHTLVDLGLSVNMQHERFAAHADHPCNGGRVTEEKV
jgi:hypothetical protein